MFCKYSCSIGDQKVSTLQEFRIEFFNKFCWLKKQTKHCSKNAQILLHEVTEQKNLCSKTSLYHKASINPVCKKSLGSVYKTIAMVLPF